MKANNHVVIVGGGAAGLSAALFASRAGARVTMLEKNEKFGKKLYIPLAEPQKERIGLSASQRLPQSPHLPAVRTVLSPGSGLSFQLLRDQAAVLEQGTRNHQA